MDGAAGAWLEVLTARWADLDYLLGNDEVRWREARHAAAEAVLLEAAGLDRDDLPAEELSFLGWAGWSMDGPAVAALAALLARAGASVRW